MIYFISATDSVPESVDVNHGHIAMTYVALCSLLILGDDLSGVDRFVTYFQNFYIVGIKYIKFGRL